MQSILGWHLQCKSNTCALQARVRVVEIPRLFDPERERSRPCPYNFTGISIWSRRDRLLSSFRKQLVTPSKETSNRDKHIIGLIAYANLSYNFDTKLRNWSKEKGESVSESKVLKIGSLAKFDASSLHSGRACNYGIYMSYKSVTISSEPESRRKCC